MHACRINSRSLESKLVTTNLKELLTAAKKKPFVEGIKFQARYIALIHAWVIIIIQCHNAE